MKKLSVMLLALAAIAVTGCGKDDNEPNNPDAAAIATPELSVDETSVTATGFTVTWTAVENAGSYVYTVDNGQQKSTTATRATLTGLVAGAHTVKVKAVPSDTYTYKESAWATISYTLTGGGSASGEVPESLKGSDYYVIQLDDNSFSEIADKVTADYRGCNIYWWNEAAFSANTTSGSNWRGNLEGWTSVSVATNPGWFGLGWHALPETAETGVPQDADIVAKLAKLVDINDAYNDFYLHIAIKSQSRNGVYGIHLYDGTNEPSVDLGAADAEYGFARDGEWYELDIPMSYFYGKGLLYKALEGGATMFAVTQGSEGDFPNSIDIDAIFIYKKAK